MKTASDRRSAPILTAIGSLLTLATVPPAAPAEQSAVRATRLAGNPIVRPDMDHRMGSNVQGPSLIRVPEWAPDPLGRYYLYFADHKGAYIRLAYADDLEGPWKIHSPGSLHIEDSHFLTSPAAVPDDVDPQSDRWRVASVVGAPTPIDSATKPHIASPDVHVREDLREIVMYFHGLEDFRFQRTRVASSKDGIHFTAREPRTVLLPKEQWEGADLPLVPSVRDAINVRVRQLRDPAVFEEDGRTYLLYSVAGEAGIAIAELSFPG